MVSINDSDLLETITQLLNSLIANPGLIMPDTANHEIPLEVMRLNNEVARLLESPGNDKEIVKAAMLSLAAEKYRRIGSQSTVSLMLRAEFEQQTPLFDFSAELLKRTVNKVIFDATGAPGLTLKNNQRIWKGSDHANSDSDAA